MSEAKEQAADAATDPDVQADEETTDAEQSVEEVSWNEAQAHFAERQNETRELAVDLGGGKLASFTVRGLDDDERSEVEQAAVSVNQNQRRKQRRRGDGGEVDIDSQAMKATMLQYGIVSGPAGFKSHREDHLQQIPPGVKDEIVDEIEDLSSLDVVERDSFQEVGSR